MIRKDFALSIIINVFLGFLWIFLFYQLVELIKLTDTILISGVVIIILATSLFGEVVRRVNPLIQYPIKHPVKIAGFVSFGIVVISNLFLIYS